MVTAPSRVARAIGALCCALALEACGPPAAPQQAANHSGAPPAQAAGGAVGFDSGPIAGAAEYLADPQFAGADAARGEILGLACAACHTFQAGGKTIVGPNLHGVFGRHAAALPDFEYSAGLRSSGLVWTPRSLDAWLADPGRFVAGTTMTFTGYRAPDDRRDLIAYLLRATD